MAYEHACVQVHTSVNMHAEVRWGYHNHIHLKQGILMEPNLTVGQQAQKFFGLCLSWCLCCRWTYVAILYFTCGCWNRNSGPHAISANTLIHGFMCFVLCCVFKFTWQTITTTFYIILSFPCSHLMWLQGLCVSGRETRTAGPIF